MAVDAALPGLLHADQHGLIGSGGYRGVGPGVLGLGDLARVQRPDVGSSSKMGAVRGGTRLGEAGGPKRRTVGADHHDRQRELPVGRQALLRDVSGGLPRRALAAPRERQERHCGDRDHHPPTTAGSRVALATRSLAWRVWRPMVPTRTARAWSAPMDVARSPGRATSAGAEIATSVRCRARGRSRCTCRSGRAGDLASALSKAGPRRTIGPRRADRRRDGGEVLADDHRGVGMLERRRPGEQLVGRRGQRVLVGPAVDSLAGQLLRRGVGDRAHRHVGAGQFAGVVRRGGRCRSRPT